MTVAIMIEAKKIKLNGNLLEMQLKYDTEEKFEYFCYDIKNDKIVKISNPEVKNINFIYQHLLLPLLKQIESGKLEEKYFSMRY